MQRKTQGSRPKSRAERSAPTVGTAAVKVDELDLALIARLRTEGRASNRSLAEALGVNDATIAARLRRLEDESIVRVVAVTDMAAFGHDLLAFALVRCEGRPILEVGEELTGMEEAIGVVVTTGRVDLVISLLARDRAHLAALGAAIGAVPGVARVTWELALDVLKYESQWAALAADDHPTEPWTASDAVDELDLRIIGLLQQDARSSNRRIAAELGVSEGTVRTRIRRMEDERIIRIQAISDVMASGLGAGAYVGITTAGGQRRRGGRGDRRGRPGQRRGPHPGGVRPAPRPLGGHPGRPRRAHPRRPGWPARRAPHRDDRALRHLEAQLHLGPDPLSRYAI